MLTSTFQDLRYELRALLKHSNFTAAALRVQPKYGFMPSAT